MDWFEASKNGNITAIQELWRGNNELVHLCDSGSGNGGSALSWAAYHHHTKAAQLLVQLGCSLDHQDKDGDAPLTWAMLKKGNETALLLIQLGANIDVQNKKGETPLHFAAANGHDECLNYLLEAGVNKDIQNNQGETALMKAAANGHDGCLNYLLKAGVNKDIQNNQGETALMKAANRRHWGCVEALAKAGAKDVPNKTGTTVLMKAQLRKKKNKAAIILSFLAKQKIPRQPTSKAPKKSSSMKKINSSSKRKVSSSAIKTSSEVEGAEENVCEPEKKKFKSDADANILFRGKVFQFPMMALVVEEFVKQDGIMKFEDAKKIPGLLVFAEEYVKQSGGKIVFASHKWRQLSHPDDLDKTKFTQLKAMLTRKAMCDVKLMWIDYSCVPQENNKNMQKAINSFADYVKCCNAFVMLIGNRGDATLQEYNKRGWCRLERIAACCAAIERNLIIYVHNATENRLLQAGNVDGALPRTCASVNPIEGDFTGDKMSAVKRIVPVLRDLCRTMHDDPRDDYDHEIAIYITNQINDLFSGKFQFSSKVKDTLSELLEKASVLKFEHFFRETMQVAEAEDFASFEPEHWEQVKAELGVIATKRLQRHLQV